MSGKRQMTLDRVLSRFGIASRAEARTAILAGRIRVNGRTVREPELWVDLEKDAVHLDRERLRPARKIYLVLYKPKGVVTSHGDPGGRQTVYDCLAQNMRWVSPVGRLDKDTSGLLLLTNDTDFANRITDPASGIQKSYLVKLNRLVPDEMLHQLTGGIKMKRGDWARPESIRRVEDRGKYSWVEVVLTEGKNREVRRMFEAVGLVVLKLVRTRIGPLTLEGLQVGKSRPLTPAEVSALRRRHGDGPR
jgi:pseudouridine synthase